MQKVSLLSAIMLFAVIGIAHSMDVGIHAFPGAAGYGRFSRGGRGGSALFVTNLNSTGPGSLKDACESHGPRTIIFRVGGQISLGNTSLISITDPFCTIAGETAPGDGIVITGDSTLTKPIFTIATHDVIVRNIRIRPGPGRPLNCGSSGGGTDIDALRLRGDSVTNCIVDHCSFSFSTDELASVWKINDSVTIQNCLMVYPLHFSTHAYNCDPRFDPPVNHGRGPLFGGSGPKGVIHVSMIGCFIAHATYRYPEIKQGVYQVVNNVLYNYYTRPTTLCEEVRADIIGNYYRPGPESYLKPGADNKREIWLYQAAEFNPRVYVKGNIGHWRQSESDSEWDLVSERDEKYRSLLPLTSHMTCYSAFETRDSVPLTVGAGGAMVPIKRDSIDKIAIDNLYDTTGAFIDHPSEIWPDWPDMRFENAEAYPDTDSDGIDDAWETKHGMDLAHDSFDIDQEGRYTNLECFLQELAGDTLYATAQTCAQGKFLSIPSGTVASTAETIELFNLTGQKIKNIPVPGIPFLSHIQYRNTLQNVRTVRGVVILKINRSD
jgi:pectate lyase